MIYEMRYKITDILRGDNYLHYYLKEVYGITSYRKIDVDNIMLYTIYNGYDYALLLPNTPTEEEKDFYKQFYKQLIWI